MSAHIAEQNQPLIEKARKYLASGLWVPKWQLAEHLGIEKLQGTSFLAILDNLMVGESDSGFFVCLDRGEGITPELPPDEQARKQGKKFIYEYREKSRVNTQQQTTAAA